MDSQLGMISGPSAGQSADINLKQAVPEKDSDIGKRFEKMLWAEMLTHAGLEKALTQSGGEAASAFSRYVVESIAEDIAEKHPLGLSASTVETDASRMAAQTYDLALQESPKRPVEYPTLPAFEGLEYE